MYIYIWAGRLKATKLWNFGQVQMLQLWPFISYNWLFLWDYTFYKWGFLSTYNWYNSGLNCGIHIPAPELTESSDQCSFFFISCCRKNHQPWCPQPRDVNVGKHNPQ